MFTQKPKQVRYLGNVYTINDDYRNILQAMIYLEGLDRNDFKSDYDFNFEQSMIVVHMIFGKDAPIHQALVNKANDVMWNYVENRDTKESEPIYQDLIQDYPIYKMDILREFNREIEKLPYLSWSDFIDMVGSLSSDSNMAQYVKIRSTPLKDIDKVGIIAERNALLMHEVIEKTNTYYRTKESFLVIDKVKELREKGIKAYITMDAGPNVKIITTKAYVDDILNEFKNIKTLICKNGDGAMII